MKRTCFSASSLQNTITLHSAHHAESKLAASLATSPSLLLVTAALLVNSLEDTLATEQRRVGQRLPSLPLIAGAPCGQVCLPKDVKSPFAALNTPNGSL